MTMRTMTRPRIQSIAAMRVDFATAGAAACGAVVVTADAGGVAIDQSASRRPLWLGSVGLQAGGPEHGAGLFRGFGGRRLCLFQVVLDAELLPLEPAQLVKR